MREKIQDAITITIVGPKKFKQLVVDAAYRLLTADEIFDEAAKPGCALTIISTIEPSDED